LSAYPPLLRDIQRRTVLAGRFGLLERYCTYSPREVRYLEVLLVVVAVTPSSRGVRDLRSMALGPCIGMLQMRRAVPLKLLSKPAIIA